MCCCKTIYLAEAAKLLGRLRATHTALPTSAAADAMLLRGLRQQQLAGTLERWRRQWETMHFCNQESRAAGRRFREMQQDPQSDGLCLTKARLYASRKASEAASAAHDAVRIASLLSCCAVLWKLRLYAAVPLWPVHQEPRGLPLVSPNASGLRSHLCGTALS